MITKSKLSGLTCPACKKVTENRIGKIAGVVEVKVDLGSGETEINADHSVTKEEIIEVLKGTPYQIL